MNNRQPKAWYKRFWVWVLIIIAIVIIGSALGSGEDSPTSSNTHNTDGKSDQNKSEFKVNETATFNDKSITVTKVELNYDTGNEFARPESGKEFVLVTVRIENNSKDNLSFNTYEFKLQDSNGVQLDESISAIAEGKLNSGSLASGGKITGNLAYEIPKDDGDLKLIYQGLGLFDNKVITFNL